MEKRFLMTLANQPMIRQSSPPNHLDTRRLALCLVMASAFFLGACASVVPGAASVMGSSTMKAGAAPMESTKPVARSVTRSRKAFSSEESLSDTPTANTHLPAVVTLTAPTDLWDRIRRGLSMPDLDNELVRDREQWYVTRPDYIQRMTERSSRYLFHIVEEIERRNLPMEIALLPFIESAFNPEAVSSARAAGMWQFMPATGESFDLKQNIFRDDRRDVLASTRAALDYLQQLHSRFGDWHLALAAYNWGQGNVSRAITRNQQAGLPTGYTDLNMPMETRMYVPKLQAVKNIIANPQSFRAELPLIGNHPYFEAVTLDRDMDVAVIARLAEISERDFRALNPSHKHPVVLAAGNPIILLPWENAALFERKMQTHIGPLATWTAWVVPGTMSAAQAAERVGMTERELRTVNNIPPRMLVRAGSSLLIPRSSRNDSDVSVQVADNGFLTLQPEVVLKRQAVRARKGDTVARLASRYGVSPANVANWNKLAVNANLKAGQNLTLMLPQHASVAKAPAARATAQAVPRARSSVKTASAGKPAVKTAAKAKPANRSEAAPKKKPQNRDTQVASAKSPRKP
jgi:membrane-bound lytic murein transglycosylase D